MFHFPRFARTRLCIQRAVRRHYPPWVSPFGNLRIKAWLAAPRSLSQLPASFIASCRLGIHRVPFLAWSSSLPAPLSRCGPRRRPGSSPVAHPWVNKGRSRHTLCLLFLAHMQLSKSTFKTCRWMKWSRSGSNRRHPACKAGALPAELRPREVATRASPVPLRPHSRSGPARAGPARTRVGSGGPDGLCPAGERVGNPLYDGPG